MIERDRQAESYERETEREEKVRERERERERESYESYARERRATSRHGWSVSCTMRRIRGLK